MEEGDRLRREWKLEFEVEMACELDEINQEMIPIISTK
jgi:hypothetical protein